MCRCLVTSVQAKPSSSAGLLLRIALTSLLMLSHPFSNKLKHIKMLAVAFETYVILQCDNLGCFFSFPNCIIWMQMQQKTEIW
jgi:hypothetical protein